MALTRRPSGPCVKMASSISSASARDKLERTECRKDTIRAQKRALPLYSMEPLLLEVLSGLQAYENLEFLSLCSYVFLRLVSLVLYDRTSIHRLATPGLCKTSPLQTWTASWSVTKAASNLQRSGCFGQQAQKEAWQNCCFLNWKQSGTS